MVTAIVAVVRYMVLAGSGASASNQGERKVKVSVVETDLVEKETDVFLLLAVLQMLLPWFPTKIDGILKIIITFLKVLYSRFAGWIKPDVSVFPGSLGIAAIFPNIPQTSPLRQQTYPHISPPRLCGSASAERRSTCHKRSTTLTISEFTSDGA